MTRWVNDSDGHDIGKGFPNNPNICEVIVNLMLRIDSIGVDYDWSKNLDLESLRVLKQYITLRSL